MLRVLSAVVVALALFVPSVSAQTFGDQTSYKWASNANYLAFAADFNGDQDLDIGVRDTNNGVFYIRFGPTFASEVTRSWASGADFQPFAADMDGDGLADIGLRSISQGTMYWLAGPSFAVQSSVPWTPGGQYFPVVADFTGDGKADLAVRGADTGTVWIRRSPGFTTEYTFAGPAGSNYQPFAGDFNGDGQADLGLRFMPNGTVSFRYGPDFNTQFSFQWAAGGDYQPFAGDINRDGRADLGLREVSSGYFNIRTQVPPPQTTPTPVTTPSPARKDVDGDRVEAPLDCDDNNPAIRPGAPDAPADQIDQDCSGADAVLPALKGRVTFSWGFIGATTVLTKLRLQDLSGGETVTVTCATRAKGCPFRTKTYTRLKAGERSLASLFGRKRKLKPGAKIAVTLSKPGTVGSTTTLRVGKRKKDPKITRSAALAPL
ncbi:FG-GAP-like repeat-containing protein [Solirubrobacter taibaiensis]|nr:FG-GAP-like repeat-containing protein [Solirubrobacter taibaiensis]